MRRKAAIITQQHGAVIVPAAPAISNEIDGCAIGRRAPKGQVADKAVRHRSTGIAYGGVTSAARERSKPEIDYHSRPRQNAYGKRDADASGYVIRDCHGGAGVTKSYLCARRVGLGFFYGAAFRSRLKIFQAESPAAGRL